MTSNNETPEKPSWASFFTQEAYEYFLQEIRTYFEHNQFKYALEDGEVTVMDESFGGGAIGVVNLAQICKLEDRAKWKQLVANHIDGLKNATVTQHNFSAKAHDINFARQYLGVKLYNKAYLQQLDSSLTIGKLLATDLFALLVFDLPDSVINVRPEQTIQWNLTNEELFEIGVENMRNKYPANLEETQLEGFSVWIAQASHFFVGNIIFQLDSYPQLLGTKGCFVGIPHRHLAVIFAVSTAKAVNTITQLVPLIQYLHEQGPGSISDSLYWFYNGELNKLPYAIEDNNVVFNPPQEFLDAFDDWDEL